MTWSATPLVPPSCSNHNFMSSVIQYRTDAWKPAIYFLKSIYVSHLSGVRHAVHLTEKIWCQTLSGQCPPLEMRLFEITGINCPILKFYINGRFSSFKASKIVWSLLSSSKVEWRWKSLWEKIVNQNLIQNKGIITIRTKNLILASAQF